MQETGACAENGEGQGPICELLGADLDLLLQAPQPVGLTVGPGQLALRWHVGGGDLACRVTDKRAPLVSAQNRGKKGARPGFEPVTDGSLPQRASQMRCSRFVIERERGGVLRLTGALTEPCRFSPRLPAHGRATTAAAAGRCGGWLRAGACVRHAEAERRTGGEERLTSGVGCRGSVRRRSCEAAAEAVQLRRKTEAPRPPGSASSTGERRGRIGAPPRFHSRAREGSATTFGGGEDGGKRPDVELVFEVQY